MKAMMLTGIRQMEMRDIPAPEIKNPTDVLIRMKIVGVCGSDVHYYTQGKIGSQVVEYPFTVGHEGAGIVEAVGAAQVAAAVGAGGAGRGAGVVRSHACRAVIQQTMLTCHRAGAVGVLGCEGNGRSRSWAISTAVAHFLHTEGVTGSNPVSPIHLMSGGLDRQVTIGTSCDFSRCRGSKGARATAAVMPMGLSSSPTLLRHSGFWPIGCFRPGKPRESVGPNWPSGCTWACSSWRRWSRPISTPCPNRCL